MHPRFQALLRDHLLGGVWDRPAITERVADLCELPATGRAVQGFVEALLQLGTAPPSPTQSTLDEFLATRSRPISQLLQALRRRRLRTQTRQLLEAGELWVAPSAPLMRPVPEIPYTDLLPPLTTPRELADWLAVSPKQLDWLADVAGRERLRCDTRFRRYRYRWIDKGRGRRRLIEHPKPLLKAIQRRILTEILNPIPPHPSAHAFRMDHSPVTCAEGHVGQRVVLSIDLRDFFPSITVERIQATFRWIGYPEAVARLLAGLCTNATPSAVVKSAYPVETWRSVWLRFGRRHLPQGAPTSPALANLCAYRLDCRLLGLARKSGAFYTRYADDLIFSGDASFERRLGRFRIFVGAITLAEGFSIQHRKTRIQRSGKRQSVLGVVVNQRPNVDRRDFDTLKAILFNCARTGPEEQNKEQHPNFRQHLAGRIAWVKGIHPARGERLQKLFDRIVWTSQSDAAENETPAG
ncbi:MAG: reverse transcriptase family protein [Planctomycetota bacterium]|nr:reverse transcriptase family protein [Planctomycetota bacterium]